MSLVGATMSKFAKCQTQANCHECPADLAHFVPNRGKDSNQTKEFCRLNPNVPNRKLKPPRMRRFEFSGRGESEYIRTSVSAVRISTRIHADLSLSRDKSSETFEPW